MRQAAVCPDLMQYQQLAADQLADADEEAMLEHLERCDVCARKVSTLVERDRLVEFIRRSQARGDGAADEGIGRLVERMSKLRPGETPAPAGQTMPSGHITVPVAALIIACPACGKGLKVKGEFAGKMVKCPHCQQAVCAAVKSAGAPVSGVSAVALSVPPRPVTVAGAGVRTGANAAGKLENTVDHQPANGVDKELYGFLAPPQAPDELGRLGPYRVLKILGAGGMGVVFRAEDPQLMRLVALKAMLPALAASASARQRFLREARAAAAIKHDHIVTIYQVGEDRGVPFLAMDFLEGEPLDARLQRAGKLAVAEVVRIGREIALGLAAANQRGLIHRDIKPANIWLETHGDPGASATGGRVKILDFGLARAVGAEAQLTQLGVIVGTPPYMAPEQGKGKAVDHRCDLFSLGCVLYRMATGEPAFRGTDVISTLMAVATEHPRPPHELEATLPPALSELIMGLLAKEPGDRPPSAQAVAETLEGVARAPATRPTPEEAKAGARQNPAKVPPSGAGRRGLRIAVTAALALALLVPLAAWLAVVMLRVETPNGTLIVEMNDDEVEARIQKGKLILSGPDGKVHYILTAKDRSKKLEAGPYKIRVEGADGLVLDTPEFTLRKGGKKTVRVTMAPKTLARKVDPVPSGERDLAKIPEERREIFEYVIEGEKKKGSRRVVVLDIGGGEKMEFVRIPKGTFLMGALDEKSQRRVEISRDFYLGKYEVTQAQYKAVTGQSPSRFKGDRLPVEQVSWVDAVKFCETVSARTKRKVNLPSEAEWEYACHAGTTTPFHFGPKLNGDLANCNGVEPYGTDIKGMWKDTTVAVGSYPANPWSLHDMHGNVWEWCQDYYASYDKLVGVKDPIQLTYQLGDPRVLRGGSWGNGAGLCRATSRTWGSHNIGNPALGFRACLRLE